MLPRALFLFLLLLVLPANVSCTRCTLRLKGNGSDGGTSVAQLTCTGGPNLAAAADPSFVLGMQADGVDWQVPSACAYNKDRPNCLLTVCGGADVVFEAANIQGLNVTKGHVLCLAPQSRAKIVNSLLANNAAAMLHAQESSLTIINTTFGNNTCSHPHKLQGATGVTANASKLHIERSGFINNTHTSWEGPALYIAVGTNATITSTTFTGNRVWKCLDCGAGAVEVSDNAIGLCVNAFTFLRQDNACMCQERSYDFL